MHKKVNVGGHKNCDANTPIYLLRSNNQYFCFTLRGNVYERRQILNGNIFYRREHNGASLNFAFKVKNLCVLVITARRQQSVLSGFFRQVNLGPGRGDVLLFQIELLFGFHRFFQRRFEFVFRFLQIQ